MTTPSGSDWDRTWRDRLVFCARRLREEARTLRGRTAGLLLLFGLGLLWAYAPTLGGMVRRQAHPNRPGTALNGGPQMVELSRDGRRVYLTNSLYRAWDDQFYPDGIRGWMVKLDAAPGGGLQLDPKMFLEFDTMRPHQVRLDGGDASSDSYCFS